MMKKKMLITIDGPAASGKSSVSRDLAARLGWQWLSTGAFYRGLAYVARTRGVPLDDEKSLADLATSSDWRVETRPERTLVFLDDQDVTDSIYMEEVGNIASQISHYPQVRKALLEAQRQFGQGEGSGLVAEGRDCGTVIFPDAHLKIYLTAHSDSRAERRALEEGASLEKVKEAQKKRDTQDTSREAAPL